MDKFEYTLFHDKCSEIERTFGRQGLLQLKHFDTSIIKCQKLLDFGAGKALNAHLCKEYYTLDTDTTLKPNFASISDAVSSKIIFDGIIANQVFEHIEVDNISGVVNSLVNILKQDGIFLATIPNIKRGMYYFNDIDHKAPLSYYHLAAFFEMNGLQVIDVYRYAKNFDLIANANQNLKDLMSILETLYELDAANFIAVVGKKR